MVESNMSTPTQILHGSAPFGGISGKKNEAIEVGTLGREKYRERHFVKVRKAMFHYG
jgi:hypothetical protein